MQFDNEIWLSSVFSTRRYSVFTEYFSYVRYYRPLAHVNKSEICIHQKPFLSCRLESFALNPSSSKIISSSRATCISRRPQKTRSTLLIFIIFFPISSSLFSIAFADVKTKAGKITKDCWSLGVACLFLQVFFSGYRQRVERVERRKGKLRVDEFSSCAIASTFFFA